MISVYSKVWHKSTTLHSLTTNQSQSRPPEKMISHRSKLNMRKRSIKKNKNIVLKWKITKVIDQQPLNNFINVCYFIDKINQ